MARQSSIPHFCTRILFMLVWGVTSPVMGQESFSFMKPDLSFQERVDDLVSRMTLEEKVSQMRYDAPAIPRLNIPEYNWWNECLHGVARAGVATVFPQAIGLAATFDEQQLFKVATVISDEARAKHHEFVRKGKRGIYQGLTFWTPNINIFRDPRWGRGMETYGEDPFLTGRIGMAFVKGLHGDHERYFKAIATPKHFAVHSGPESERHTFNAQISERDLRETYLPHFRDCIVEAKAFSVMCAYNRFRGDPCCGSNLLLQQILRDEWGFQGYVVSDCWAIVDFHENHKVVETPEKAATMAVQAGTDLNCGSTYPHLNDAVEMGLLDEAQLDVSLKRLFMARMKLGFFDPPDRVSYTRIPYSVNNSPENDQLALDTARKSMVLLKNDDDVLPLAKDIGTLAVIGPNADDLDVLLGNYNGWPTNPVTPLRGIRDKVSLSTRILYAQGCELAKGLHKVEPVPGTLLTTPEGERGLWGEYFDNNELEGEPLLKRIDERIDFYWGDAAPDNRLQDDNFSVRWTGYLHIPKTTDYELGAFAFNKYRVYLQDTLLVKGSNTHHPSVDTRTVRLEKGKKYKIRFEFMEFHGDAHAQLVWAMHGKNLRQEALIKAEQSDAIVLCMGLSPRLEGEEMKVHVDGFKGGDRVTIDLPAVQKELMKDILKLDKPTVLVLLNGSALAINWSADNVPAIVEAWYPGQRGGSAIADVLFGDYNPAGRLPVTFYKSVDQLTDFGQYDMQGRTYRYMEKEPLFPFGYGLSFTRFEYDDLNIPESVQTNEQVNVQVTVKNDGDFAGEEVVQLYIRDKKASFPVPVRSLKGIQRIFLQSGERRQVNFTLDPKAFSLVDDNNLRIVEPGEFEISLGGKQPGFDGLADASTTEVKSKEIELTGEIYVLEE